MKIFKSLLIVVAAIFPLSMAITNENLFVSILTALLMFAGIYVSFKSDNGLEPPSNAYMAEVFEHCRYMGMTNEQISLVLDVIDDLVYTYAKEHSPKELAEKIYEFYKRYEK